LIRAVRARRAALALGLTGFADFLAGWVAVFAGGLAEPAVGFVGVLAAGLAGVAAV
jgi:hypothetical protein